MPKRIKKRTLRILIGIIAPQLLGILFYFFYLIFEEEGNYLDYLDLRFMIFYSFIAAAMSMLVKSVVYSIIMEFLINKLVISIRTFQRTIYVIISIVYWIIAGWIPLILWSFIPCVAIGSVCGICLLIMRDKKTDVSGQTEKKTKDEVIIAFVCSCAAIIALCITYLYFQRAYYQNKPVDYTYFPDKIFNERQEIHEYRVSWYTKYLEALKEPSIYKQRNKPNKKVFRFTWLPAFYYPVSIRLEIQPDGSGILHAKMLYTTIGDEPGRMKKLRKTKIDKETISDFLDIIERENFWDLPSIGNDFGMDGADWIIEGLYEQKYHLVHRWCPERGALREIGIFLMNLSNLKINEIY